MNAEANRRNRRVFTRRLIVLPALVVALGLALTGVASAQTPFQASVTYTGQHNSAGCANGAYSCGTANTNFGPASWDFYPYSNSVQTSCGTTYWATTYFTLQNHPGSTLVLYEHGNLCGPGLNANGYFKGRFPKDFGRPYSALGSWSTITTLADCSEVLPPPVVPPPVGPLPPLPCSPSTGVFAGQVGLGNDTLNFAGAHAAGSYSGALEPSP